MNRRQFLQATAMAAVGTALPAAQPAVRRQLLLRSSWQTVNIGDIAHTPGMLALLERHRPEFDVTLWPSSIDRGVDEMLIRRFPRLKLARTVDEQRRALAACDFFLHGSGPGLVGARETQLAQDAAKPYGFGGVTLSDDEITNRRELLQGAKFVYLRDTDSMRALLDSGLSGPVVDFGPDATFAIDLHNDEGAQRLLKRFELEPRKFLCAIPRLRYTPYWQIHGNRPPDPEKQAVNEKFVEQDHAKLRAVITAWVRETKMKAFVVPEMTYQLPLLKTLLFDKLPSDVQTKTVVMDRYWITDEAVSLYSMAAAMVSCEQHSPIMAVSQGTPAVLVRQPTDTRKGQMWRDLGMSQWIFEIDDASGEQISQRVVEIGKNQREARDQVIAARDLSHQKMAAMVMSI